MDKKIFVKLQATKFNIHCYSDYHYRNISYKMKYIFVSCNRCLQFCQLHVFSYFIDIPIFHPRVSYCEQKRSLKESYIKISCKIFCLLFMKMCVFYFILFIIFHLVLLRMFCKLLIFKVQFNPELLRNILIGSYTIVDFSE